MKIRKARVEDAEELVSIYKYYVENTDITFEYDTPSVEEFAERIRNTLKKYPYIVAEKECSLSSSNPNKTCEILGYAYAGAFKGRRAYDWSVETSIYVKHGAGSHGIGTMLYNELEKYLKKMNIININACITYPNEPSEEFHKKLGYKTVAHFTKCGYKFGQWRDMIWMEKIIGEHKDKPEDVIPFPQLN